LTNPAAGALNFQMAIQRLTVLDVKMIASELNDIIIGKKLKSIIRSGADVYLQCENVCVRYSSLSGAPFMSIAKQAVTGNQWLNQVNGGVITAVEQYKHDRIIKFTVKSFDKLGRAKQNFIFIELFQNGNIILTGEDESVRSSLKRKLSSGDNYDTARSENPVLEILLTEKTGEEQLTLIKECKLFPYLNAELLTPAQIRQVITRIKPHLIQTESGVISGYTFYQPLLKEPLQAKEHQSFLEAIAVYIDSYNPKKSRTVERLIKQQKKIQKKIDVIKTDLEEAKNHEKYSRYGELILANLSELSKGETIYSVTDPYSSEAEKVEIEADPAQTPDQNANRYFIRARKFKASITVLKKRLVIEKQKLKEIESKIADPPVSETTFVKKSRKGKPEAKIPYRHVSLEDDWQVYIGKSAHVNDELTFSFAHKGDIWMHAWQAAGSHLILRHSDKKAIPPKHVLLQAASLAAFYSKAKHSSKVPVIYTEVRHVRKVRNAPGKVIVLREKQLMVKPLSPDQLTS